MTYKDVKIGDIFGELEVKEILMDNIGNEKRNRPVAFCSCTCGNFKKIRLQNLVNKDIKSCGCLKQRFKKHKDYKDINGLFFDDVRKVAVRRNISFNITIEDVWNVWEKQNFKCALTGNSLVWKISGRNSRSGNASIDRIDSKLPYTKENIQIIHKHLNMMKMTLSVDDFVTRCYEVTKYQMKKATEAALCLPPDFID